MSQRRDRLRVIDAVLQNPDEYRAQALAAEYRDYDFGHAVFRGIATEGPSNALVDLIRVAFPALTPSLTFFRKSPLGQQEPHFIHTDVDMGEWSGVLYLNPAPPEGDGTAFWTHRATGTIESAIAHERSAEGRSVENWILRARVPAKFNRLVLFPSTYFHSRALYDNWGEGDGARLTQVVFGKGVL